VTEDMFLDGEELEMNDPPRLSWVRARDAANLLWRENPKLHDLQQIVESVRRYGFQEPGKFDAMLFRVGQPPDDENPLGAVKAGNGRYEAVAWLEAHWDEVKNDEEGLPRGLALDGGGAWCVPVVVGTDAKSTSAAMEYAVDANNVVLSGGDLDGFDASRLWGAGYADLLGGLDELPVSVDAETLAALSAAFDVPDAPEDFPEYDESVGDDVEWIECPECGHRWPA